MDITFKLLEVSGYMALGILLAVVIYFAPGGD